MSLTLFIRRFECDSSSSTRSNQQEQYAFLTLLWGMLADVDLDSEWLRCLGELRLYLYAVRAIIAKRTYRGRISLQLARSCSPTINEGSCCGHRVNLLQNSGVSNNNSSVSTINAAGVTSRTLCPNANSNTNANVTRQNRRQPCKLCMPVAMKIESDCLVDSCCCVFELCFKYSGGSGRQ